MKQYIVELTSEERYQLQQIVAKGNTTGYRIKYAHILLKADQGKDGPGWSDPKIAEAFDRLSHREFEVFCLDYHGEIAEIQARPALR